MVDVSGGGSSIKNHNISQQYWNFNNGDVSSVNVFINSHILSQFNYLSTFKQMGRDIENVDLISGYGYIHSHTVYQHNYLK